MKPFEFKRTSRLIEKIVLVDGLTRVGKSMLGPILASLEHVEVERVEAIFENIALLWGTGKLSRDAAVELLQLEADTRLYESFIGRNSNFRYSDHSSVFNNPNTLEYVRRLFRNDLSDVVERIRRDRVVFQVQTHDTLGMIDPFFDAFGERLYVLEMIRDPIDLIYSWHTRGWGHRFTDDPLSLTFTVRTPEGVAPWYDLLLDEDHDALTPMDRIICMIEALQQMNLDRYRGLDQAQQRQILWITFEDFVTQSSEGLARVERFIGTRRTPKATRTMKKQRCPRILEPEARSRKRDVIETEATAAYLSRIDRLYEQYHEALELART